MGYSNTVGTSNVMGRVVKPSSVIAAASASDVFAPGNGQTVFNLTHAPIADTVKFILNHAVYEREGVDWSLAGSVITFLEPDGLTIANTDQVTVMYNF